MTQELEQLLYQGSYQGILDTVPVWSPKQKREGRKWLKALWKEGQGFQGFLYGNYAHDQGAFWMRLVMASVATALDAKEALEIPPPLYPFGFNLLDAEFAAKAALIKLLAGFGRDWVASYVQLAAGGTLKNKPMYPEVLLALAEGFDLPVPTDEAFVKLWCIDFPLVPRSYVSLGRERPPYRRLLPKLTVIETADGGTAVHGEVSEVVVLSPLDAVQSSYGLRHIISAVFAQRDGILGLGRVAPEADFLNDLSVAVTRLVEGGALDRRVFIDDAIAALLRADAVTAQRMQAQFLLIAKPDAATIGAHIDALVSLLASGHGSAAGAAQTLLRERDAVQALDGEVFFTACQIVFSRKEKGLRADQFAWAVQRLARHPAQVLPTMRGMMGALAVDDFSLQKKVAQKILDCRHLVPEAGRGALLALLEMNRAAIDGGLFATLAAGLGLENSAAPAAALPNAPNAPNVPHIAETRPLTPLIAYLPSLAALREIMAEHTSTLSLASAEQMIDVVLSLLRTEPETVRQALHAGMLPFALNDDLWLYVELSIAGGSLPLLLAIGLHRTAYLANVSRQYDNLLLKHGRNQVTAAAGGGRQRFWADNMAAPAAVARMRFSEIVMVLQNMTPYAFLAKPSQAHGSIDPAHLIERLALLAAEQAEAHKLDLLLALMRTQQPDAAQIQALNTIGSRQGKIAADFFSAGGMGQMTTSWQIGKMQDVRQADERDDRGDRTEVFISLQKMAAPPAIDDIPLTWADGFALEHAPHNSEFDLENNFLAGVMPNNGEILAALHFWGFRKAAGNLPPYMSIAGGKAAALALPKFIAARGPAGPALHLAILFVLSADDAQARIVGSDCLLELIAQQRYNSALAAQLVAAAIQCGSVKFGRLAASLGQAVEAGAASLLWPLVRAALIAGLESNPPSTGLHDLLALATRMVVALQIRESIPALTQAAARKGNNKMLTEARRLLATLTA